MTTNQNLLDYHREIQMWHVQGSVLQFLMRNKIREFYRLNGIRIETIQDSVDNIMKKYLVFVNDGNNKQVIKYKGEGKDKKPVFLDGKKEDDFNKELQELMNVQVNINI